MNRTILGAAASAVLILSLACGGGGGGGDKPPASTKPVINIQPTAKTVSLGEQATFTVQATGNPAPSYQWHNEDGSSISGATTAYFTTPATVKADDGKKFYAVVRNSAGSATSSTATLHVQYLEIGTSPNDVTVAEGSPATFTFSLNANPACTYQWKRNGVDISGQTSATYTISNPTVATDDGARITCTATNVVGTVTSDPVTLCVHTVAAGWPTITTQPADVSAFFGGPVTFQVVATGSPTSYQWQKDGVDITGATNASYSITSAVRSDEGAYRCRVINGQGSTLSQTAALTAVLGWNYKGMAYVTWGINDYSSANGSTSRTALEATGTNWVTLLSTYYQATTTSTSIYSGGSTPTDASMVAAIQDFHSKGIKVMVKPHLDVASGDWRGSISVSGAANLDAWFASYTSFMLHYAQMAENNNAEALCIGTELKEMTKAANRDRWIAVIDAIKAVYSGPITYAANASGIGDEYTTVSFWDHVDLLGMDAYFRLTNNNAQTIEADSTLPQLVAGWGNDSQGVVMSVLGSHTANSIPVIFTELGYKSVPGADYEPWNYSRGGTTAPYDPAIQQNCYEAAFQIWAPRYSWMQGIFWWAWQPAAPGQLDYTPRGKPAETTLKTWYGGASNSVQQVSEPEAITAEEDESAALLEAVKMGWTATVEQLLAKGVNLNKASTQGRTALMEASEQGDMAMVQKLIKAGADLNTATRAWGTALDRAERSGQKAVAALLLRSGARSTGKSVGDTVCVRPWGGHGYCGIVTEVDRDTFRVSVTRIVGCDEGCAPRVGDVDQRAVGGPAGLQVGDIVTVGIASLTHTGVQP